MFKAAKGILDQWRDKRDSEPVPENIYGRTIERSQDPAGVFRIKILDAHRGPGASLLPKVDDATWMVLTPLGSERKWVPVDTIADRMYLDANDPVLLGVLIERASSEMPHEQVMEAAQSVASGKGNGLALAYYDLDGPGPHLFIPESYMDSLEDEWRFTIEIDITLEDAGSPSFKEVIHLISIR